MRVIAGSARGIPLKTVPDGDTRPILDRLKKSLFSILDSAGLVHDCRVMDLYCGAGSQGIEALSRGARSCLFVEQRAQAVALLKENLEKTRLLAFAEIRRALVAQALNALKQTAGKNVEALGFELILYDPPFVNSREMNHRPALEAEMSAAGHMLATEGRLVLRTEKRSQPPTPPGLTLARHWTDGKHALCFYQKERDAAASIQPPAPD